MSRRVAIYYRGKAVPANRAAVEALRDVPSASKCLRRVRMMLASARGTMYNSSYIKRGLTRPANLQLVQGGFPNREMWLK